MDGPMLMASGATFLAGGGRSHPGMDPRGSTGRVISPIGFEATMSVAMQLENELKTKQSYTPDPVEECVAPGVEEKQQGTNGSGQRASKEGSERMDDGSPSLAMEELMEEEEDGSLCPSTNGSYDGDASLGMHSVDGTRASLGVAAPESNGRSRVNGLNGSLGQESSEGDYYEGSEGSGHQAFARQAPPPEGGDEEEAGRHLLQCHLCAFTGNSKYQLNAHLNSHYDHKCNHCDYTSRTEGRLKRHVKDFHSEELQSPEDFSAVKGGPGEGDTNGGNGQSKVKLYRCKQCSYVATVKTDFWDHSKSHIKMEKLLTCPKCPFVTEYKHHLEYHLRNHFGSKPFKCPKCNYSCVNKSMLNSHMKSHSNIYQYRCANCTYATKYCHSLKLHLRKYAHTPSTVLNPDGTPNPIPVIDVYGTRRGPRTKKSSQQQDEMYANPGGNELVAFALSGNGALSPSSAALPFFYQGGAASNGFHPAPDGGGGHPRPRNPGHSPAVGPTGSHCSAEDDGNASPGARPDPLECGLCDFSTQHRDTFSKHMLLHAAAENQDLCNLYGISSDNLLLQESNQQPMDAASVVAVATALGLNPSSQQQQAHRAEMFRHHAFNLLQIQNGQELGQLYNPQKGASQGSPKEHPKSIKEEQEKPPPPSSSLLPNPLEHLRAFSEQVSVKPFMMREFSSNLFASNNSLPVQNLCPSPPSSVATIERQRASPSRDGMHGKGSASERPKGGRRGIARSAVEGLPSLGPLDLSSAKGVPQPTGMGTFSHQFLMQNPFQHQLQQRHPMPAVFLQQLQRRSGSLEALEIGTDAPAPSEANVSPTQGKNRRKGRAFKLDRICMKLQKERDSPPVGPGDDSVEEDEGSKTSDPEEEHPEEEEEGGMGSNGLASHRDGPDVEEKAPSRHQEFGDKARPCHDVQTKAPGAMATVGFEEVVKGGGRDPWNEAYQCPYCDMAFRDCVMYTVHMGYHGFKDPFKCNMCGQQTNDKVAFFLHIARTAHL